MSKSSDLVLDSNILIYYLSGDEHSIDIVEGNDCYISILTEIEVLGFEM